MSLKQVARLFKGSFKCISRVFLGVSRMFHVCFMFFNGVLMLFCV